jgi:hypothetical protein
MMKCLIIYTAANVYIYRRNPHRLGSRKAEREEEKEEKNRF